MPNLTLTVPGVPTAQPRQRHRVVTAGGRTFASNYTPTRNPVNAFKAAIALACQAQYHGQLLECPVAVSMQFNFPRPQRLLKKSSPFDVIQHASRPDVENVAKAVLDALTGVLWVNDSQVWSLDCRKFYAARTDSPHTWIQAEWEETNG